MVFHIKLNFSQSFFYFYIIIFMRKKICKSDIMKGSRLWQSRLAANDSQPASIKSGPFLKGATLWPFSCQTATRPRDIMVFPEPPFRAAIMILGKRFNIFLPLSNDTLHCNRDWTLDLLVKSFKTVMQDLIRHPEMFELIGFRLPPEWRSQEILGFLINN